MFKLSDVENLAFEGGGVKGVAYAGALKVLEEKGFLDKIQKVAGTSAGAITACMLSLGYSADKIAEIVKGMNLNSFEDWQFPWNRFRKYGIHPGKTFLKWLSTQINQSPLGLSDTITFAQLREKGGRDLHVFACDIYTHKLAEFSAQTTPDARVAGAVRASMSIPLFFNAWKFPDNIPNDHLHVDGGMIYNYPVSAFDHKNDINWQTLGLRLDDVHKKAVDIHFGYGNWIQYVKNTFETLMTSQDIHFIHDAEDTQRTIIIDDLGVSATDFDLSEEKKQALITSGKTCMEAFLKQHSNGDDFLLS